MKQKRNLVLVHLESLNMLNYRMNKDLFPTICDIENRSMFFEKYYSSATSTIMVMSDLAYGGLLHDESCGGVKWVLNKQVYQDSFVDMLNKQGYKTYLLQYPKDSSADTEWSNRNHRYGNETVIEEVEKYNDYLAKIQEIVGGDNGFVLWTCCYTSNISFNRTEAIEINMSGLSAWEESYRTMDKQVDDLMRILEVNDHLQDTTIVLYGDHGDDLFQHGWYGGLSHAVEPYETLIHTPLFILDNRVMQGKSMELLSTVDIRSITEKLLGLPERPVDINEYMPSRRAFVISRNLYAAQMVRIGNFEKGYSVTDGQYLLMASNRGMALYYTLMDPSCQNNLLEFLELNDDRFIVKQDLRKRLTFHFPAIYDKATLQLIAEVANFLREYLQKEVTKLYQSGECEERIYEIDFHNVREVHYIKDVYDGCPGGNRAYYGAGLLTTYYRGKKVVLYGAGGYGRYCFSKIIHKCHLVAWVDRKWKEYGKVEGIGIESPESIRNKDFDLIIVVVLDSLVRQDIQNELIKLGVDKSRIIC